MAITAASGAPQALPDVALESIVLFHLERVAAIVASSVFVLVILVRAWRGELPSEVSSQGIKYATTTTADATGDAMLALRSTVAALQTRMDRIEDAD